MGLRRVNAATGTGSGTGAGIGTGTGSVSSVPEYSSDPISPTAGQAWVLRTLENPVGTLQAFVGGFMVQTATDDNKFEFSFRTSTGQTVRTLLS